jgi:RNA polymerase sigma-70 factor, ECF subfamily
MHWMGLSTRLNSVLMALLERRAANQDSGKIAQAEGHAMSDDTTPGVTRLLRALEHGGQDALDRLIPLVYGELRKLAHASMQGQGDHHTLQTTALVHEVYMRLLDQRSATVADRNQFFAIAAMTMRRVLVDQARKRLTQKRGGQSECLPLNDEIPDGWTPSQCDHMVLLDEGLEELAKIAPRQSQVVELRFFGDRSVTEVAEILKVSKKTVERDWQFARAWLASRLQT